MVERPAVGVMEVMAVLGAEQCLIMSFYQRPRLTFMSAQEVAIKILALAAAVVAAAMLRVPVVGRVLLNLPAPF